MECVCVCIKNVHAHVSMYIFASQVKETIDYKEKYLPYTWVNMLVSQIYFSPPLRGYNMSSICEWVY